MTLAEFDRLTAREKFYALRGKKGARLQAEIVARTQAAELKIKLTRQAELDEINRLIRAKEGRRRDKMLGVQS